MSGDAEQRSAELRCDEQQGLRCAAHHAQPVEAGGPEAWRPQAGWLQLQQRPAPPPEPVGRNKPRPVGAQRSWWAAVLAGLTGSRRQASEAACVQRGN